MSRIVAIAGRSVERSARSIAAPWTADFGIIFMLHWLFDVVMGVDMAVQRLGGGCVRVDRAAVDQTPVVHNASLSTHTDQHSYGSPTVRRGWVSVVTYPQWVTAHLPTDPPAPQPRQRRRPSVLAVSAALHGGAPR
jgi:hypothetical protein